MAFLKLYLENLLLKIEPLEITPFLLQQFFRLRGGGIFPSPLNPPMLTTNSDLKYVGKLLELTYFRWVYAIRNLPVSVINRVTQPLPQPIKVGKKST